ncbi:MAG: hypothetical protein BGO05_20800 [Rhizobiales bacterium 63-7]|nr:hypothetical protein [Hyphomicrobiales bacterium]OJU65958.1 MAG: hypothetical protein BGO05_20800 [Rhizobiales bacterium 63-7]
MTGPRETPPIGGSLSGSISAAADWIARRPEGVSVHEIKQRFGLTALQACEAIRLARAVGDGKGE